MAQLQTPEAALAQVITAIGRDDFARLTADAVCQFMEFDLAAIIVHRRHSIPMPMFDNFDIADGRQGIHNYVNFTHRINPILKNAPARTPVRACDFMLQLSHAGEKLRQYFVLAPDEELGFRTVGWPEGLEEISLYFDACGGIVELGIYRERTVHAVSERRLQQLGELRAPLAAAFETHVRLQRLEQSKMLLNGPALTPRERQIVELLLVGCSSEAVALRLNISRYTVKDHRKNIFRKLSIGSLAELFTLYPVLH
jgi:DNA-binding CsgD family transcriptional regulator